MSQATIQTCNGPNKPETPCEELARKIDEFINKVRTHARDGLKGLKFRFAEQVAPGAAGPDTTVWKNHETAIRDQQRGLRNRLERYDDDDCDQKGPPLPSGARDWAFRPLPSAEEWQANNPVAKSVSEPSPDLIEKVKLATGLSGVALAVYLIVSEGSRLFPLRNLVPVP